MDLRLYGRVLWRFRVIVVTGIVLAAALAFLSVAKVSFNHGSPSVTYRKALTYESLAKLLGDLAGA